MTRKEMITRCVDDQIERGIVKPENRELQIRARMKGYAGLKPMSKNECTQWYEAIFGEEK